jgi:hypothetical protein
MGLINSCYNLDCNPVNFNICLKGLTNALLKFTAISFQLNSINTKSRIYIIAEIKIAN